MSELVEVNLARTEAVVFDTKASVQDQGWILQQASTPKHVLKERIIHQIVPFLNKHASLPQGAILHMDAGKAALLAVQDADFCDALIGAYKVPTVARLHIDQATFQAGQAMFRVPVTIHDTRSLLEVRTVSGKVLTPLS